MNSDDLNTPQQRSRWPVLALVVVFVLPISVAWLAAGGVIDLGSVTLTNRGTLFRPAVDWREQKDIEEGGYTTPRFAGSPRRMPVTPHLP